MSQQPMILPPELQQTIINTFGESGAAWIEDFSDTLTNVTAKWSLTLEQPFNGLSYNFVTAVRCQNGETAVLKLGVPNDELASEIAALQHYNGQGITRLIAGDSQIGALLMEKVNPGTQLATLFPEDDDQATIIAADIMKQLWRPVANDHPFPTIQRWLSGFQRLRSHFDGDTGPFPQQIVQTAENLSAELITAMDEPVLLHGDLHHYNILAAERQPWLAIDPKGVVGEAVYDVGALIRNPVHEIFTTNQLDKILRRRIDILAEHLPFDKDKITGWAFVQSLLSVWWLYEDRGTQWQTWLPFTEQLAKLLE